MNTVKQSGCVAKMHTWKETKALQRLPTRSTTIVPRDILRVGNPLPSESFHRRLPFHPLIIPFRERRRTYWPTPLSVFTYPLKRRSTMQFPMPHPRRFCRFCPCWSFLPGRTLSCWPALAQQTQQFTFITHHFDKHMISISSIKPLLAWLHCHRSRIAGAVVH